MTRRAGLWTGIVLAAVAAGGLVHASASGGRGMWPWGGRAAGSAFRPGPGAMMRGYAAGGGAMMGGRTGAAPGPAGGAGGVTTVSPAAAASAQRQVPAGASVDAAANTLGFSAAEVRLTVVAAPAGGREMSFGIAGLTNPTITAPAGARMTVTVINDSGALPHNWLLTAAAPPFAAAPAAVAGASVATLPGRTAAGASEQTVSFAVPAPGTYHYICGVPGHAAAGMYGTLRVTAG